MASWPPSGEPIAHGTPTSSGVAVRVLLRPLRCVVPIGWIGGRYTTSKPISAMASRRFSAVRKVTSGPRASFSRWFTERVSSPRAWAAARTRSRSGPRGAAAAARSYSSAPSSSTRPVSIPAGILMPAACRQVATGSDHASTR